MLVWRADVERSDEAVGRVGPVQLATVHSQAVDDVVDAVELCRRRVRQTQCIDRLAATNSVSK